jgi:hypothetical protein
VYRKRIHGPGMKLHHHADHRLCFPVGAVCRRGALSVTPHQPPTGKADVRLGAVSIRRPRGAAGAAGPR